MSITMIGLDRDHAISREAGAIGIGFGLTGKGWAGGEAGVAGEAVLHGADV